MKSICWIALLATGFWIGPTFGQGLESIPIRLASDPALSPSGDQILFTWRGDIWHSRVDGTELTRLTNHDADERQALYSPDGKKIAFISDRTGSDQIFIMNANGSDVQQVTFHSAGYSIADWFPDGQSILALGQRDHYHRDAERLIKISLSSRQPEKILIDATIENAKLSADGKQVLFTREGERWWRKGYQGERAAQIWRLDLETLSFEELLHEGVECLWPLWLPNAQGFYFTKGRPEGFELWRYRFSRNSSKPAKQNRVYGFKEDSIVFPAISRDGTTIVFRHLFDLYVLDLKNKSPQPHKIPLSVHSDIELPLAEMRRELSSADDVAFSDDGLEIAMAVGGDIWVMDTKLREPRRITRTAGYEDDIQFAPDGQSLWFTSVIDGQVDIWKAIRKSPDKYWWQNSEFELSQITHDQNAEQNLRFSSDGSHLFYQQSREDLVVRNLESGDVKTLVHGFSEIDYDISKDGAWLAYALENEDFNSEIWLTRIDGTTAPVNVSRHPDNDGNPVFSPDGKILAFTGRRVDSEVDIYYVYLQQEQHDETSRDRLLQEAIELMNKKRSGNTDEKNSSSEKKHAESDIAADSESETEKQETKSDKKLPEITVDLEGIHERLRQISIANSFEGSLLFSPDSKKLAFTATVDGKRGWYTVEFPSKLTPQFLSSSTGSRARWSKESGGILLLRDGLPSKVDDNGKLEAYSFQVAQDTSRSDWLRVGFEKAWLVMREAWYDARFNNRNWDGVRRKYVEAAAQMHDPSSLGTVIELMLGELNGSHLGFTASDARRDIQRDGWADETAHLGVRFDDVYPGPGLRVRDTLIDGPADKKTSKLGAGDVVLEIDGHTVDPSLDLTTILNGRLDRDIVLKVQRQGTEQKQEEITIRPISFSRARGLLYENWLQHNRAEVDRLSNHRLGYLHIRAMDMSSFYEFERQLYSVGYGREGLIIDVRDNGGGSTTDLLLTALTQPQHAITIPRGGQPGYPQDRMVFASWNKPIIVLCNQNSYSNAEIFSHAIQSLGRGKVVGVQTAGGVVSTGAARVNDVGTIRVPFRGWFLSKNGQDMERNGCLPDVILWPKPGELPKGIDQQLELATKLLMEDIEQPQEHPSQIYASERDLKSAD
ncbi:MAG: PD40 domain-containing protein [Planctomycetales bacterium]|nr:PD40 domain-containing protein [Planctomycetales bacterium]